ncbi:MAG TPA: GDSL-type esterase/lipase family protein [Chitinophagaceae bacterium]|jgi:lysophospholipase L1-like esterase
MTISKKAILTVSLFVLSFFLLKVSAQSNLDFEQGLKGWDISGDKKNVSIDQSNFFKGKNCVKIGNSGAEIFQRLHVSPLSIVQLQCYVKSENKDVKAYSFIRFYNSKHELLLEYKSQPTDSLSYQQAGNYTETPALTDYMEIGAGRDSTGQGAVYIDEFNIETNIGVPAKKHDPLVDLDKYMEPFWKSDTIYNETVLLYSVNGKKAEGKLLYTPEQVLSVKDFGLQTDYKKGIDYTLNGNIISRDEKSTMPFRADTSFDTQNDLAWFNLQSQWIVVTYTHRGKWGSDPFPYKGDKLPNTLARLKSKSPLRIVAFGMSITRGLDVSSYDSTVPYMPTYVDLFAGELRKTYHYSSIQMYNAGLPGATVDWGATYADKYINPLKPDLVIIDFGMNDFWRLNPSQFQGYIKTIMEKVKADNPKVEFLLLSNMKFDPDYVLSSDKNKSFYQSNLEGYSHVLKQMETNGVVNVDMYAITNILYQIKKAKDCLTNPLHPNDYLARWYAQAMSAVFEN